MPALDGVRALAVLAVLAFHGGMPWARGGFLGVDAFFVLSGLPDHEPPARRVGAERAHRPGLVLGSPRPTAAAGAAAHGHRSSRSGPARCCRPRSCGSLRGDGLAALFYVANWRMILRGGDYFAQTASPSPLEHTWSLGIEEQFYLAWPLLLAALLAGTVAVGGTSCRAAARDPPVRARSRPCRRCCWPGGTDSDDPGRAYYGTDTRGASLLVGAGACRRCSRRRPAGAEERRGPTVGAAGARRARGVLAASRSGPCLGMEPGRRGRRLAVPRRSAAGGAWPWRSCWRTWRWCRAAGPRRLLSVAPLVLVGRISYGIYLWHWPTFLALNADRTGRQGTDLFVLRCLVTLAVWRRSYVLVERPIRVGWPAASAGPRAQRGRRRRRRGRPSRRWSSRPRRSERGRGTTSCSPRVHSCRRGAGPVDVDRRGRGAGTVSAGRGPTPHRGPARTRPSARRAADHHPLAGRDPGHRGVRGLRRLDPGQLPAQPPGPRRPRTAPCWAAASPGPGPTGTSGRPIRVSARTAATGRRCGAVRSPPTTQTSRSSWSAGGRPWTGCYDGRWTHVGDPAFDDYLRSELELAIATAGAHGARVVLATEPYNRRGEQLDGSLFPEDEPERVTAWNDLLRDVAADHPDVDVLDFGARVSPEGHFTWTAGGIQVRSDGLHLTPSGVQGWIAPWLLPRLRTASARP